MAESAEIVRLNAIIELFQKHHASCLTVSHENNALLQQDLSNLGVNVNVTRPTTSFVDAEYDGSRQFILCGPDEIKRKKNELASKPPPKRTTRTSSETNCKDASQRLIANFRDAEGVELPLLYTSAKSAGVASPFDRGKIYAQRTLETIKAYSEKQIQARVELFLFLSSCVVLENLSILTHDQTDQLMSTLAESQSADYLRRMRDGAAYLNHGLVSGLLKKAWTVENATSVIAMCAPCRPYWYARIKNESDKATLVREFHGCRARIGDRLSVRVSDYVSQWEPSLSLDQIHRALGYPNIDKDRNNPQLFRMADHPSSLQAISTIARSSSGSAETMGSSVLQGPQPNPLLGLLTALGSQHSIPEFLLSEAGEYRSGWNSDGGLVKFGVEDIGLDPMLASLLRNHDLLKERLQMLESDGSLTRNSEGIKVLRFPRVGQSDQRQSIVLACFFFTGCEYSRLFSQIGNAALPLFQSSLQQYRALDPDERFPIKSQVLQALLQASKFANLGWKKHCIRVIEEEGLEDLDPASRASFVLRKSFVLRSNGNWNESSAVLRECLQALKSSNRLLNAIRGFLIHSLASNLWERENFREAEKEMLGWESKEPTGPSIYETRSYVKILTGLALVSLHQGLFEKSRDLLLRAREQYDEHSRAFSDVTASLADVFCELEQPSKALELLQEVIDPERPDLRCRYMRNCFISYAEASICLSKHKLAERILEALKNHYEASLDLDRHDRRRHIRTLVLLAQNLHRKAESIPQWEEVGRQWENVVRTMQEFDESSSWDFAMVCFSKHHTLIACDNSSEWYHRGAAELRKKGHFWMRGMTTYWKQFLTARLPTLVATLAVTGQLDGAA